MNGCLNIKGIFEILYPLLQSYAATQSGNAFIASDELHAWYLCQNSEQVPKIIMVWTGETIRGDFSVAAINRVVDSAFDIVISRNRGLQVDRAQTLVWGKSTRSLFEIVEDVRDMVRCVQDPAFMEWPLDYRGTEPWQVPGWIVDAYRLRYSAAIRLPSSSPALDAAVYPPVTP